METWVIHNQGNLNHADATILFQGFSATNEMPQDLENKLTESIEIKEMSILVTFMMLMLNYSLQTRKSQ